MRVVCRSVCTALSARECRWVCTRGHLVAVEVAHVSVRSSRSAGVRRGGPAALHARVERGAWHPDEGEAANAEAGKGASRCDANAAAADADPVRARLRLGTRPLEAPAPARDLVCRVRHKRVDVGGALGVLPEHQRAHLPKGGEAVRNRRGAGW